MSILGGKNGKALLIPQFEEGRFFSKINIDVKTNCWNWLAAKAKRSGYGVFTINRVNYMAHRVAYKIFKGQPSIYLVVDHLCKNRKCVNPDHLQEKTQALNVLENSCSITAMNKIKTHCIRGHEFTEENTKIQKTDGNARSCITCNRIRDRKSKEKRKNLGGNK